MVGYSQDYSNAIVEAVKKKLNKPDLQVKTDSDYLTKPYSTAAKRHFRFLNVVLPPTTSNAKKQAAFSDTIFVVGTRLLTKKGGDIKDFANLKDKAVVVTSGTTSEVFAQQTE